MKKIEISIPATTANLGPGFDCLGLALDIFNVAVVSWQEGSKLTLDQLHEWAEKLPFDQHAIAAAYCYYADQQRADLPPIEIDFSCDIPIARGLGSSATCAIAGIVAGQYIHKGSCNKEELLKLTTDLEGHPDNAAPAILGGLVLSASNEAGPVTVNLPCHENIHTFLMIPDFELSTDRARAVLPELIPHRQAVKQLGAFGFLLQGLAAGSHDLLRHGNEDFLHEPYRRKLLAEYDTIKKTALDCGCSAVSLSGAGPSLLGLFAGSGDEADQVGFLLKQELPSGWELKRAQINHSGAKLFLSFCSQFEPII